MKKILTVAIATLLLTGCTSANDAFNDIKQTIDTTIENAKQGVKSATAMPEGNQHGYTTLSDEMQAVNAKKKIEIDAIDKEIKEKEIQIAKIVVDTKLTNSQKKAKTSLLQKDILTLKQQKENAIAKYRKIIQNFKY